MHTYAKWQHTESSPMSPPRVAISGKKTLSISFENFNFLLLNAFVQTQTMTAPFSPPPAVLLAPGVYFRQQNSDDSKSLIDSFFCSVDHALNLPLGFCWCHGVIGVTIGEKNQRFGFRVLFLSRNWGLESHIFVARRFYTLQRFFNPKIRSLFVHSQWPMSLLWKLDPLSTKTISFKTEKSTQKVENEPS